MKPETFQLTTARNGEATLRVQLKQGGSLFVHSSYDPEQEAQNWLRQVNCQKQNVIVLFGLGLGYHLQALREKIGPKAPIFVVEPSPQVLEAARNHGPAQSLIAQDFTYVVSNWEDFRKTYTRHGSRWKNLYLARIPVYTQIFSQQYKDFCTQLKREANSLLVDQATLLQSALVWQCNLLKNLRFISEYAPVSSLFGLLEGHPAIIVSAGPSLTKNIHLLRQARGKALILAVGTVVRTLQKRGIRPDLVVSFDGHLPNYTHHFQGVQLPEIPLIFGPALQHRIVEEHLGPKVLMLVHDSNRWVAERLGVDLGFVRTGPSIANTALDLCRRLGAHPIILVGQDLAYTGGQRHAPDTHVVGIDPYQYQVPEKWLNPEATAGSDPSTTADLPVYWQRSKLTWVEGVNGDQVARDDKMLTYLHWFEQYLRDLPEKITVIDATECGARIKGTRVLTLAETLDSYCTRDISPELEQLQAGCRTIPDYALNEFGDYMAESVPGCGVFQNSAVRQPPGASSCTVPSRKIATRMLRCCA